MVLLCLRAFPRFLLLPFLLHVLAAALASPAPAARGPDPRDPHWQHALTDWDPSFSFDRPSSSSASSSFSSASSRRLRQRGVLVGTVTTSSSAAAAAAAFSAQRPSRHASPPLWPYRKKTAASRRRDNARRAAAAHPVLPPIINTPEDYWNWKAKQQALLLKTIAPIMTEQQKMDEAWEKFTGKKKKRQRATHPTGPSPEDPYGTLYLRGAPPKDHHRALPPPERALPRLSDKELAAQDAKKRRLNKPGTTLLGNPEEHENLDSFLPRNEMPPSVGEQGGGQQGGQQQSGGDDGRGYGENTEQPQSAYHSRRRTSYGEG